MITDEEIKQLQKSEIFRIDYSPCLRCRIKKKLAVDSEGYHCQFCGLKHPKDEFWKKENMTEVTEEQKEAWKKVNKMIAEMNEKEGNEK